MARSNNITHNCGHRGKGFCRRPQASIFNFIFPVCFADGLYMDDAEVYAYKIFVIVSASAIPPQNNYKR